MVELTMVMADGFTWTYRCYESKVAAGLAKEYAQRHGAELEAGDALLIPGRLVFLSGKEDGNRIVGYANIDEVKR